MVGRYHPVVGFPHDLIRHVQDQNNGISFVGEQLRLMLSVVLGRSDDERTGLEVCRKRFGKGAPAPFAESRVRSLDENLLRSPARSAVQQDHFGFFLPTPDPAATLGVDDLTYSR